MSTCLQYNSTLPALKTCQSNLTGSLDSKRIQSGRCLMMNWWPHEIKCTVFDDLTFLTSSFRNCCSEKRFIVNILIDDKLGNRYQVSHSKTKPTTWPVGPDWSVFTVDAQAELSSLGAQVILLVLSCCGLSIYDGFSSLVSNDLIWAATWQNQQSDCAPSEDSDQPGHSPSLIRVRCPHEEGLGPKLPIERTAKTVIRLGGCSVSNDASTLSSPSLS